MKLLVAVVTYVFAVPPLIAQAAPHVPQRIVSDWTNRHVLFPQSKNGSTMARMQRDPRFLNNWYSRHPEARWRVSSPPRRNPSHRDWSVSLSADAATSSFEPVFDFNYALGLDTGYGTVTTTDINDGQFLATGGNLTVTDTLDGNNEGTYPLYPGGPAVTHSPSGEFIFDNVLYPSANLLIDKDGLLFVNGAGVEVNLWSNVGPPEDYEFAVYNGGLDDDTTGAQFALTEDPGGGQTFPAKFVFDVTQPPSCTNDYVVIGVPATPVSGGQANIVGVNNLYSGSTGGPCGTSPSVMFAYASGTGEVPASVAISQDGTGLAYIENLTTGSSYFHVLTLGTTGSNGTSATAAVVPGSGNNAVDQTVLLSPDGVTTQSSTNAVWVAYTPSGLNDFAFATTYSSAGTGSGYLYKITNVFNGSAPTIAWSVAINAIPSTPVYDTVSNNVFFTDSNGRIDYVVNSATAPSVVYGPVLASGATSETPVVVDSVNEMVYATFNSNGTNALVVQAPTSLASSVSVPIGAASTMYAGPYEPDFNNAFYTGSGTPLLYIAGTGTGAQPQPTLYSVGFNGSGVLNSAANPTTVTLATGTADSSPVTEFYNATQQTDYLFVGVTNNCAVAAGGTGGCVMSFDITGGFPTSATTALAATGGTSGIIIDNDSSATEASNIYYSTKTGATLVKASQSALQ